MDARCEPGGRERERWPLRGSQGRLKLVDEWEGQIGHFLYKITFWGPPS